MATSKTKDQAQPDRTNASDTAQMEQGVRDMKAVLDAQPKVRVKLYQVPKGSTDAELAPVPVQINGYVQYVPRGVSVDVPEGVAQILEEAGY